MYEAQEAMQNYENSPCFSLKKSQSHVRPVFSKLRNNFSAICSTSLEKQGYSPKIGESLFVQFVCAVIFHSNN